MLEQIAPLKTRCFCGQMKVNIFENFGVRHINWEQKKYGIYITKNSSSKKKKKKTKYVRELKDSIEGNSFLLNKNKKKINMKIVILIVLGIICSPLLVNQEIFGLKSSFFIVVTIKLYTQKKLPLIISIQVFFLSKKSINYLVENWACYEAVK